MTGPGGSIPSGHYIDIKDGKFGQTTAESLRDLFVRAEASDHLVIHFHGGLVSREEAHRSGAGLYQTYKNAGTYPVFFVWNSGPLDTAWNMVRRCSPDRLMQRLVAFTGDWLKSHPVAGGRTHAAQDDPEPSWMKLGSTRARADEPVTGPTVLDSGGESSSPLDIERERFIDELSRDPTLLEVQDLLAAPTSLATHVQGGTEVGQLDLGMWRRIQHEIRSEDRTIRPQAGVLSFAVSIAMTTWKVVLAIRSRLRNGTDHRLGIMIQQEIYRIFSLDVAPVGGWKVMKEGMTDAFKEGRPGAVFLAELTAPRTTKRRVTLVGHSAGAIYVREFLRHAAVLDTSKLEFDVVLLAAACTYESVNQELDTFQRLVSKIMCIALNDTSEQNYWEMKGVLNGSLLYCIAGLLETSLVDMPLLGMQRYHNGLGPIEAAEHVQPVKEWLGSMNALVWSGGPERPDGWGSGAETHTGFYDDPTTKRSIEAFLR